MGQLGKGQEHWGSCMPPPRCPSSFLPLAPPMLSSAIWKPHMFDVVHSKHGHTTIVCAIIGFWLVRDIWCYINVSWLIDCIEAVWNLPVKIRAQKLSSLPTPFNDVRASKSAAFPSINHVSASTSSALATDMPSHTQHSWVSRIFSELMFFISLK